MEIAAYVAQRTAIFTRCFRRSVGARLVYLGDRREGAEHTKREVGLWSC